ncbi:hypothetical protein [Variovorax paradoxus]|uniref:hypothetical protein n=1 Tax=Variovorax paradoxus TaxID=34073 RepID=UPI0029C757BB|nr:hypothetical protein [Variovorax paradoxus]WPH22282.1 hypothetical protein RZE78_08990 [Variovorax paradoxus]
MSFMPFIEHRVTEADLAELREWETACSAPRGARPLFPAPLSAPAQFAGSVDATHERVTLCPRTLAEAFGEANAGGVIVPLPDTNTSLHKADRIVVLASALAGLFLLVYLSIERIAS